MSKIIKSKRKTSPSPLLNLQRCKWLTQDPVYIKYHDEEWGNPIYNSFKLFEMLCLEGQQAGLSWLTILKRREGYRKAFCDFNPKKISKFSEDDIKKLLNNPGIIRHKQKIEAIIQNAVCYLEMEKNNECFSDFLWNFVNNEPVINTTDNITVSDQSIAMSKALKSKGFKYVGPTICYAFMQACGLVNDHCKDCFLAVNNFVS